MMWAKYLTSAKEITPIGSYDRSGFNVPEIRHRLGKIYFIKIPDNIRGYFISVSGLQKY